MAEIMSYVGMSLPEIEALDRKKTIFLMAVSPIEVHGPHLPLGTDVFVACEMLRRYAAALHEEYPEYTLVALPSLYLGSDALPVKGSLSVPAPLLRKVLLAYVKGLAVQGFRYLFLADNHGGPRHQMAIEAASRLAWRRHRFYLINPFNHDFRLMVQHDPAFLRETGLQPGNCGDDADAHAGTNETSLMLQAARDQVRENWRSVAPSLPPPGAGAVLFLGRIAGIFSRTLGEDMKHLAATLGWVGDPQMKPYMGAPALATAEAGEAMLKARTEVAMRFFRHALAGEKVRITPLLWGLRLLQILPE
ncbi:MAG: creatininase family protein [Firmicutes bacterium]|nr:creatininase family protein [Bacillota bacterium]